MNFTDKVEAILKEAPCNDYKITSMHKVGYEAYFVKKDIDIIRNKELDSCQVVVYVDTIEDENKFRGSAKVTLSAAYLDEEIKEKIQEACVLASYVKEPFYPLPIGFEENQSKCESSLKTQLKQIAKALMEYKLKENEALNSFEIFANETEVELRSSQGLKVSYTSVANEIEVIVNVNREGHEIEIYHADTFANKLEEEIQADLKRILQYGQDKMMATPLNVDIHRIAICNRDVEKFLNYFNYQINSYTLYAKMSNAKIGDPFFREEIQGDAINYKVCAKAEGASSNPSCDSEGVRVRDASLIENGIVRNITGSSQYAYYLNSEVVPSLHRYWEGGQYSESELKKTPYLECVEFSDFSVDVMSGDFAGEIRLAYYFDGEKKVPFTGGSVSGNLKKLGNAMYFSSETNVYDGDVLPKSVFIDGVSVAKGV